MASVSVVAQRYCIPNW